MDTRLGHHWFTGSSTVSGLQTSRAMVHEDVGITTPNGHTCLVDHIHFASRTDAVLAPHSAAPRAARRLLRSSCERLPFPTSVVRDAAVVFGEMVAMSVQLTRQAIAVSVDADGSMVSVRVTTPLPTGSIFVSPRPASWSNRWHIVESLSSSCDCRIDESGTEMSALIRTPLDVE